MFLYLLSRITIEDLGFIKAEEKLGHLEEIWSGVSIFGLCRDWSNMYI